MSTAYSPPYMGAGNQPAQQMPQGYPPPQNYPGWQAGLSEYVPCPRCARPDPEQVKFTWWGGVLGPRLLKHVKCNGCGLTYNGKSGQSNTTNIVIYSVILGVISFGIALFFILR